MVHCHPNARLTPRGRAEVFAAVEAGMTVVAACLAFNISRRCYYRWRPRWQAGRQAGLVDRSSRPLTSPQRLSAETERLIAGLRITTGWGPDRIAAYLGLARASVHRAIRRCGLSRPKPIRLPVIRYEYAVPGGLLHLDTKKLGRIVDHAGHRAHGDRRSRVRGAGWEVLHVALDDASRLVYAELLPDERAGTTAAFTVRALRWFRERGVTVERILTDNGPGYRSLAFARVARWAGIRLIRTRPYRPQTNGKVERWIGSALRECLYLEVFHSAEQRWWGLAAWIDHYNRERPHLALNGSPPLVRLQQLMNTS
ncbi:MAG TPA: IS481 family transposase [Candidatus Limnocylindria bacterium]|nr:IS481 family transposase [Candidatus Limnocylindria bacterium]